MKNRLQHNLGFLLVGIGLLVIATGSYELIRKDRFCAKIRVRIPYVVLRGINVSVAREHKAPKLEETSQNEFAKETSVLTSDTILSIVVSRLNLASRWDEAELNHQDSSAAKALATLKNMIAVQPLPDRPVAEISVLSPSAAEAEEIANAVANAYRDYQFNEKRKRDEEHADYVSQTIRDKEAKLNRLREIHKAPPPESSEAELSANYPEFYATKLDLDFYNLMHEKILADAKSNDFEIIEPLFPPASPIPRKKTFSLILITTGLLSCGWGIKLARDSRYTGNEA